MFIQMLMQQIVFKISFWFQYSVLIIIYVHIFVDSCVTRVMLKKFISWLNVFQNSREGGRQNKSAKELSRKCFKLSEEPDILQLSFNML